MEWFQFNVDKLRKLKEKKIMSMLAGQKGKLLDVGCGSGFFSQKLSQAGFIVSAIDQKGVIGKVKDVNCNPCNLEEKIPFSDESFDLLLCTDVIEHIKNTERLFSELNRVLKKDAVILVSTPYHGFVKNILTELVGFNTHFDPEGEHLRFYSRKSLETVLEKNGFKVENVSFVGRFWPLWAAIFVKARKVR
tara:strand:- start:1341 stop:1913 length:573 start_codon:yes stop_codon:yes gene_type:complete